MEKRLYIKIIFLLLMFGLSFAYTLYFYDKSNYVLFSLTCIISLFSAIMIVIFQLAIIKKLKYIISAIENKDYMFVFVTNRKNRDVNSYLNTIKDLLENARKEVEDKERYYHMILDNISSAVIIANRNNSILKLNKSTKTLLGLDTVTHINNLSVYYPGMSEALNEAKVNSSSSFSFSNEKEQIKVSIKLTLWENSREVLKIYTLNNISSELEYKELESWSRLTRVLTHEIMNSLTPIISISSSLVNNKKINDDDVATGLNVIHNTSNSLVKFVDNYRQLSRIATPEMAPVYVRAIVESALRLYANNENEIELEVNIKQLDLMIFVDKNQILQIVINLVKNAIESIGENGGKLTIEAYCEENEDVIIKISDTGSRIPADVADHIFIPFFTTKNGGSGIGLSISRQIMRLHNGSIALIQTPNSKSFLLTFK